VEGISIFWGLKKKSIQSEVIQNFQNKWLTKVVVLNCNFKLVALISSSDIL